MTDKIMDYEKAYKAALATAKQWIKDGCTDKEKICLEFVFSELRESEDERIRKWIYNLVENLGYPADEAAEKELEEMQPLALAYLEKQKEQNLIMANSPQLKEQKPNPTEDMPYITDEHFYEREPVDSFRYKLAEYMTKCCTKKEGPYGYEYGISAESILKMAKEELLKMGVVQKPVEWSEEDEKTISDACCWIAEYAGYLMDKNYGKASMLMGLTDKLKSIRPQPKVELSEDVKKTLDEVSHILIGLNYKQVAKDYKQAIEKLLYSHPSWKPSEEQMAALLNIEGDLRAFQYDDKAKVIAELYEQLKRL